MGFRSENGYKATQHHRVSFWKGKKLSFTVWNKGTKGLQVGWNKGMKFPERSGENSPAWRGGITPLREKIKRTNEWKRWIKSVLERDDYRCVWCGVNNNRLHVDHIKPYSLIRKQNNIKTVEDAVACDELWDTDNGRTLCINCHKKTDTYLSKAFKTVCEEERARLNQSTLPK